MKKKLCKTHNHKIHMHNMHNRLHKHEEGFHNSAEAKEEKLPANPDNEDNRTDDCAYCQHLDAVENADGTAGMHDCDHCKEYDESMQNTGGINTDDCPYCQENSLNNSNPDNCEMCQEYNAAQGTKDIENYEGGQDHPEVFQGADHICNCPNCPKNEQGGFQDQTNVAVEDMAAQRPDECPECQKMYGDAIEEQPGQTGQEDPNLQGHETAEEILDLLDQEPGKGEQTPEEAAKKIDNTEMPQGDQMKEGTSVTEDFGPTQKEEVSDSEKDLGEEGHNCDCPDCPGSQEATQMDGDFSQDDSEDSEEQPDMSEVMQGGLDDHADEQKKQQILDMVGQTLAGFKANKQALEESKEQNQGLYNSCIQMLKSMIELCKLLGLEPKMPEQSGQEQPKEEAPIVPSQPIPKGNLPPKKAVG